MLSINIPVYNIEVGNLVSQLSEQAEKLEVDYEIRIYDDFSEPGIKQKNSKTGNIKNVIYREMKNNLGRAAIRNKMGFDSAYKYLLFIDADSALGSKNYLNHYLRYAQPGTVICGGTSYNPEPPEDPEKILRWVYGRKREAIPAQQKNRNKGFIITSNNFLIEKSVFEKIHFREDIKKYGHEDTMLGYDLFRNGYKIIHFDNPVEHTGLENSAVFLNKTKMAVGNLHFISENLVEDKKAFIRQVRFLKKYRQLTRYIPENLLRYLYRQLKQQMETNLLGEQPDMKVYDFYKLGYFASIKNREQ